MSIVFIRNDDVRGELDNSLMLLTESILSSGMCISHAVEPANVTVSVASWLLLKKEEYPEQLEIIQHGLDHLMKSTVVKGEFGGERSYRAQLEDIARGKKFMNKWFGNDWFPAFSFPFGTYNKATLDALNSLNYPVITTGTRWTLERRLLNAAGRILRRKHIGRFNIVYNAAVPPGYEFLELPVILNDTKIYLEPDGGVQKNRLELLTEWKQMPSYRIKGILTHHRYNSVEDTKQLVAFLNYLKEHGSCFKTIKRIYEEKMGSL